MWCLCMFTDLKFSLVLNKTIPSLPNHYTISLYCTTLNSIALSTIDVLHEIERYVVIPFQLPKYFSRSNTINIKLINI